MPPADSPDSAASTPPAGDDASKSAQSPNDMVRVYNRSRKQFTHSIYPKTLGDGSKTLQVDYISAPNAFCTIPRWIADLWVKGYPNEMLPGDDALRTIDAGAAELADMKEQMAKLDAEKKDLEAQLAAAKAQLAGDATGGGRGVGE